MYMCPFDCTAFSDNEEVWIPQTGLTKQMDDFNHFMACPL